MKITQEEIEEGIKRHVNCLGPVDEDIVGITRAAQDIWLMIVRRYETEVHNANQDN